MSLIGILIALLLPAVLKRDGGNQPTANLPMNTSS